MFFTSSFCEPEVVPASPLTSRVAPLCWATESKCTPWLPTALRAALYCVRRARRGRRGRGGGTGRGRSRQGQGQGGGSGESGGGRGGAGGGMAQGGHDLHSPGGPARWRGERRLGQVGDGPIFPRPRAGPGSAARQTALMGPTETVAMGASGRTFSPHLE